MEFRILGPLEIRDDNGAVPLPRRRERVVLAALLLRAGEVVSIDRLVEAVWGESPPRTAIGSLQNAISELRRALSPGVVRTQPPGYVLGLDSTTIDAVRFERAVGEAAALEPRQRTAALADALALWRGPALADLADEPFARNEAARLDELRIAAVEARLDADLELGRGIELVGEIEAYVAANPLRERLRGQLMLALYRAGRQAAALDAYRDARTALVDELGIDPSPELQELERRILRQDPTLAASITVPGAEPVAKTPALRKTVTVLAAALEDVSVLDPELLEQRIERFLAAIEAAVQAHGGALDRFLGSEAVATFGVPAAHEDDALRAARAAVELREAIAAEGDAVRVGMATGEALIRSTDGPVIGEVVTVAASLCDAAAAGVILAAETTFTLVQDAVTTGEPATLGPQGVRARPLEAVQGARGRARRVDTPFVGRTRVLAELREALARATAQARCIVVTVFGDAGMGKTRLADELANSLVRGRVVRGQCLAYGAGSAFGPILDIVETLAGGLTEADVVRVTGADEDGRLAAGQIAGLADPQQAVPLGDAFWAVRHLLTTLARDDPAVVVLDDVHWAEPALLDLVDYVVPRVRAPVVLLCLARPELLDRRPGFAGAASEMDVLHLEPLEDAESRALLGHLDATLPSAVRERIVERGAGNPLYLEQLTVLVADEHGDRTLDEIPASIEAVLASRIDLLPEHARTTLQHAAVVERDVARDLVVELCEPGVPVDTALLELTRRRLLVPHPSDARDDWYQFHHVLVREVAYRSLPKTVRAALHERAAAWWAARDVPSSDELVGWHLERSHHLRTELQADDPELPALAEAAGERLAAAGIRHSQAADPAAVDLLSRASTLLPDDRRRAAALLELGPWLRTIGDATGAQDALAEALRVATAADAGWLVARARIDLAWHEAAVATRQPMRWLEGIVSELLPTLERAADSRGLMRAWQFLATVAIYDERYDEVERAAREAERHAVAAGWLPLQAVGSIASALLHGPRPVLAALVDIGTLLDTFRERRHVWAAVAVPAAVLRTMQGDDETADALMSESREYLAEYRDNLLLTVIWSPLQHAILTLRGDRAAAIASLEAWCRELRELENDAYLATGLARLAALRAEDAGDDADTLLVEAARLVSADDRLVQAIIRSASARRLALGDDVAAALRSSREAVDILAGADALCDRARLVLDRARVLELIGDGVEAAGAVQEARSLYEEKGNTRAVAAIDTAGARALT